MESIHLHNARMSSGVDQWLQAEDYEDDLCNNQKVDPILKTTNYFLTQQLEKNKDFWIDQIESVKPTISLPIITSKKGSRSNQIQIAYQNLFDYTQNKLQLLTILVAYLHRINNYNPYTVTYSGNFLSSLNNEQITQLELATHVPLNIEINPNINFLDLEKQVSKQILNLEKHLTYQTTLTKNNDDLKNKEASINSISLNLVKSINNYKTNNCHDISLVITDTLELYVYINREISQNTLLEAVLKNLTCHIKNFVEAINDKQDALIKNITLMDANELQKITQKWNNTKTNLPNLTLIELFEQQVERTPNSIAIVFEDQHLTYQQLNEQSNKLAHHLKQLGVKPNTIVGLCIEKSLEMIIGLLGILKADGAYLPLDPGYPENRLKFMLENSKTGIVLTQKSLLEKLPFLKNTNTICLDNNIDQFDQHPDSNLIHLSNNENLAYIIYTSGSTGTPKGVLVKNLGVTNIALFIKKDSFAIHKPCKMSLFSSLCFDASIVEIWPALLSGSTLYVIPEYIRTDCLALHKFLQENSIEKAFLPPAMLNTLPQQPLKNTNTIMIGGDTCNLDAIKFWSKHTKVLNAYGPTETSVCCTIAKLPKKPTKLTIGKPCGNNQIYILDKNLNPMPIGTIGEIYIAGTGITNGYLGLPEMTKEKFIHNPLDTQNPLMYKTGDLGRFLTDGQIEFIGRTDDQIKIRGFRIELDDINNWLKQYPGIQQSIALVKKNPNGNASIVAYITFNNKDQFEIKHCKAFLSKFLPGYMIPSEFILLDSFPLNPSGKIDKKSLLNINTNIPQSLETDESAHTKTEEILIDIWSKALGLNPKTVGTKNSFFDLGGDSLSSNRIIIEINKIFNSSISIKDLFEQKTIESLAKKVFSADNKKTSTATTIKSVANKNDYPLSYPQEMIWMHQQIAPKTPFYNESLLIDIKEETERDRLETAINTLIKRHEILRTNFILRDGQPRQIIKKHSTTTLEYIDLTNTPPNQKKLRINKLATEHLELPFDLEKDLLIRSLLIKIENKRYQLYLAVHHLIIDGISAMNILFKELQSIYQKLINDKKEDLVKPKLQYKDYCVWQKNNFQAHDENKSLAYWKKQLKDLEPLQIPTKQPRTNKISLKGDKLYITIPERLVKRLKSLSAKENSTLFITLLTALNILLKRYSNQNDIAIGTTVAGRNHFQLESMMGLFINTLVLRNSIPENITFKQLLQNTKTNCTEAYAHQDLPFQELLKHLNISSSHQPFPIAFVFESSPEDSQDSWKIEQSKISNKTAKFELLLGLEQNNNNISGFLEYNTCLYDRSFIKQLAENFLTLLEDITKSPNKNIAKLEILPKKELNKILDNWNNTKSTYPSKTIHQIFEDQVAKTPNKIAASFNNKQLTYDELNKKANQLANHLKKLGAKTNAPVAVLINHNMDMDMIISMLAILKAGAAYLPMDIRYPRSRILNILKDSNPPILITDITVYSKLKLEKAINQKTKTVFIEQDKEIISKENYNNPPNLNKNKDTAYMIYTSGSTGKPKGAMLPHKTITNLINWQIKNDKVNNHNQQINVAQFASFGFDVSLQEFFYALLNGHHLRIVSTETKQSITKLINFLQRENVNKFFIPPSILGLLAQEANSCNSELPHLNEIIVASEALIIDDQIKRFFNNNPHIRLTNHYGPSETHVVTSYQLPQTTKQWTPLPPIGKPIANTQVYILDKNLQPVPVGVNGELYISGVSLAKGYLKRLDLNKTKFIKNPFSQNKNNKLYKTGDLVKWLPNGEIAFIERIDNLVKIRGFRVELDEIEHNLLKHKSIAQCAVRAHADGHNTKKLTAYIVPEEGYKLDYNGIKKYLKSSLPDYMVPPAAIKLEKIPLTVNGKVDNNALPQPNFETEDSNSSPESPPKTPEEKILAETWSNILKINYKLISTNVSFFDIGGHSLSSLQLLTEIKKTFGIELEPQEILEHSTISTILSLINKKRKNRASSKNSSNDLSNIILIKDGKKCFTPIFLIHPVGGTVFWYKNLAKYLKCDNPIYGIQDPSINTKNKLFDDLKTMASFYLKLIRQIQSKGPYILGGASFGGTVAVEIAQQLKKIGEKTDNIMLFDSWALYPDGVKERKTFEDGLSHMHASLTEKSSAVGLDNIKTWLELQWHRANILWSYEIPKKISEKITLFKARDPLSFFDFAEDESNHWQKHAIQTVDTFLIPGDHETIFQGSNVQIMAEKLNKIIK